MFLITTHSLSISTIQRIRGRPDDIGKIKNWFFQLQYWMKMLDLASLCFCHFCIDPHGLWNCHYQIFMIVLSCFVTIFSCPDLPVFLLTWTFHLPLIFCNTSPSRTVFVVK